MSKIATLGQQYEIMAGVGLQTENHITFNGANRGDPGNITDTPATIFTVTGLVAVKIFAIGETTLVGSSSTLTLGTATAPAAIIPSTIATAIHTHFNWWNATPAATTVSSNVVEFITEENIILTVGTASVTAGSLRFVAIWRPLSADASMVSNPGGSKDLSASASISPSASLSPSSSASTSASISPSSSISASISPSSSLSPSASRSPSSSASSSKSPSASSSPSTSQSPSSSTSASSSASVSPSASGSPSASASASVSLSTSPSSSPSASQ